MSFKNRSITAGEQGGGPLLPHLESLKPDVFQNSDYFLIFERKCHAQTVSHVLPRGSRAAIINTVVSP